MSPAEQKASEINKRLGKKYPEIKGAFLEHTNALEILIATILSAQCTDKRVNIVTKELFKKYKKLEDYVSVSLDELRKDIKSISYPNSKAKNIRKACRMIIKEFNGKVPKTMEELITLPGVGRKTANIVLHEAYGKISGIACDTHVCRCSYRLGLTEHKDPKKIEQDLINLLPRKEWRSFSVRLIQHGRDTCNARKPKCSTCLLKDICPRKGGIKSV